MTQLECIIQALRNLGGKANYRQIYREYENICGISLTKGQEAGIRKTIEDNSSDSQNFKGKNDIFYSVNGMGKGD